MFCTNPTTIYTHPECFPCICCLLLYFEEVQLFQVLFVLVMDLISFDFLSKSLCKPLLTVLMDYQFKNVSSSSTVLLLLVVVGPTSR